MDKLKIDISPRQTGKTFRLFVELMNDVYRSDYKKFILVFPNHIKYYFDRFVKMNNNPKMILINGYNISLNDKTILFSSPNSISRGHGLGYNESRWYYDEFDSYLNNMDLYFDPNGYYTSSPNQDEFLSSQSSFCILKNRLMNRICLGDVNTIPKKNNKDLTEEEYQRLKLEYIQLYLDYYSKDLMNAINFAEKQLSK